MTKNWTSKERLKRKPSRAGRKGSDTWESDDKAGDVAKTFVLAMDNSELKYTMIPTLFPSSLRYFVWR